MRLVDLPPRRGESLPGYLLRASRAQETDPRRLYGWLGLRPRGHTLRYVSLVLDDHTMTRVCWGLELPPEAVRTMLLQSFGALDLSMLTGPHAGTAHRDAQRKQWLFMSGSRFCPACLREVLMWRNYWQLPWAFVCLDHHVFLVDTCPSCGRRPDLVVRRSDLEVATADSHCRCGARWTDAASGAPVDRFTTWDQYEVLGAARNHSTPLWGRDVTGGYFLAVARGAGALYAAAYRENSWSRRPYLTPPALSTQLAVALQASRSIVFASSIEEATGAFDDMMAGVPGWGEARVWDHLPPSSPLSAVAWRWLHGTGRPSAQLGRTRRDVFSQMDLDPGQISVLTAVEHLPPRWLALDKPLLVMRQATVSLATARLAGASTWAAAGRLVGIDGRYAGRLVRHTLRSAGGDSSIEVTQAAAAYARTLVRTGSPPAPRPAVPARSAQDLQRFAPARH